MFEQKVKKDGILLVNKPKGMTSHDVVDVVRGKLKTKKVGHAGTLDPLAEGLLIILVGRFTKAFPKFSGQDKEYQGILKLGEATLTGDAEGKVIKKSSYDEINEKKIREAFSGFLGEIDQIPPMVSALRVKGRRLYSLARRGITVERPARKIKIYSLEITKIDIPYVEFSLSCSKGTYVRKLAEDIGSSLGCGAHMTKILRSGIGSFKLSEAVDLDDINDNHLRQITF